MNICWEPIWQFLEDAKRSTYANKDAPKVISTRLSSEDYQFQRENLIYHDTYFGGRDFLGSEVVYKDDLPVWGMNYYGYILSPSASEKDVYDFLRKALMQKCNGIIPTRGPQTYEIGDWRYTNRASGTLKQFTGSEEVHFLGKNLYQGHYHGGLIQ